MRADLQRFRENDEIEPKFIEAGMPALDDIGVSLDQFFDGAFTAYPLGDVLYDLGRDPMVGVMTRENYRKSFPAIHQLFTMPGIFEFYLEVFRAIWGESVAVEFEVPEPGILNINAQVLDIEEFVLIAREIFNNTYQYNPIIDRENNRLTVRDLEGIKSQAEIDALMKELAPDGIYVTTTLTT